MHRLCVHAPCIQNRRFATLRYTGRLMSLPTTFIATSAARQPMGMMLPAFTRAMGARMITTITRAAT